MTVQTRSNLEGNAAQLVLEGFLRMAAYLFQASHAHKLQDEIGSL